VVGAIGTAGERLRVVGGGHSWSAVAAPDGHAMTLDHLTGIVSLDEDTVVVRAGTRIRDLSHALARRGLSLPVLGSIQHQSVAGAVATGTHGSSLVHGNLASLVTSLRVVTGRGEVVALDHDQVRAGRVHLGVLGVVTQVGLRVVPSFTLRQTVEHVAPEQAAAELESIARSAEYVKVWWLPGSRVAQVVRYERTTTRAGRAPVVLRAVDERLMHRWVFPTLVRWQHRRPAVVARVNDRLSRTYLGPRVQVGAMPLMLNTPFPMRHRETEAALPVSRAGELLGRVVDLLQADARGANFPLEVRFVRADDAWLSPAHGDDTCQIGAYSTAGPRCDDFFAAFWDLAHGARPHWGKELSHTSEELRPLYPRWDDFQGLRDRLDPDRLLSNDFTRSSLGG
jgi:L-gulono-1,4-lactone dehydrogenase